MGAKATQRTRARKGKRAGKKAGQQPRRLYPESVPPGMVAEVFDVSGAEDEAPSPSLPPPSAAPRDGSPRRLFSKPPPAPPRPSARPLPTDEAEELELDEDLLSEDLSDRLVTPLPTSSSVPPRRASAGVWLVLGVAVLGLGVVLGTRSRTPSRARAAPPVHARTLAPLEPATPGAPVVELEPPTLVTSLASGEGSELSAEPAPSAAVAPAPSASTTAAVAYAPVVPALRVDLDAPPFDAQAAGVAISAAFGRAAACRGPDNPSGYVTASLTYAPSGRITSANVSGVFAGTPVGGCIAAALRGARVPPFSGDYTTVKRTTLLGPHAP